MNILEEAIIFATHAHEGQLRKMTHVPYILHPAEVGAIIATMTDDQEVMAAGLLHDTIEDCGVDPKEIREKFGPRVAALVQSETEDRESDRPAEETWLDRKEESLLMLRYTKDRDVRILWLADKLSNMRSFYREHLRQGEWMWQSLHQKDPHMHEWYYRKIAELLSDLAEYEAYTEYVELIDKMFGSKKATK